MDTVSAQLLSLIRTGVAVSRAELVRHSGVSRGTVGARLDALTGAGIIVPADRVRRTGGRPGEGLRINPGAGVLLGADVGSSHTRSGITDLAGTVLATHDRDLDIDEGPDVVLGRVLADFHDLLIQVGRSPADVMGVAIGIPGPVENETGEVVYPPTMRGWNGVIVPTLFREAFGDAPVAVDNDANLIALGEYRALSRPLSDVVVVKVGMGIGAGIIANGRIVRGAQGAAGNLGHLPRRGGALCRCGQYGCAEATAGGWAIARELRSLGRADVRTSADILELAARRDADAVTLLGAAGHRVGDALTDLIGVLNPARVIVAGNLGAASVDLLEGIRQRVVMNSHPLAARGLTVLPAALGAHAGLQGAAELAGDVAFAGEKLVALIA